MNNEPMPVWTEGVCGDGAVILRDGVPVSISDVIGVLNLFEEQRAYLKLEAKTWAKIWENKAKSG